MNIIRESKKVNTCCCLKKKAASDFQNWNVPFQNKGILSMLSHPELAINSLSLFI